MYFSTASEWLSWIATIHIAEIDLGLERVQAVAARLGLLAPACPVIIVGGTNGKGSTVAGLEAIYRTAGYHTGAFTSPFLFKFNEEVRVNGKEASDDEFCTAFAKIEEARAEIALTPFEFHTLAALLIFQQARLDVMILEIGLGGRLDAVNIIDADVAIVTNISIDHVDWLGSTREAIAHEKAGIFRSGKAAVIGEPQPPQRLLDDAHQIGAHCYQQGSDFQYQEDRAAWTWTYANTRYDNLPLNSLATQNMANVLMAVYLLQDRLPVSQESIAKGLMAVNLPGRIQIIPDPVTEVFDVSHNQASIALLARHMEQMPRLGKTRAVFSMLKDKEIMASLKGITHLIDVWYVSALTVKRAASVPLLQKALQETDAKQVNIYSSIEEAYNTAKMESQNGDTIVIFGSFHTVADVWKYKETLKHG